MDNGGCGAFMTLALFGLCIFGIGKAYERGVEHGIEAGICLAKGGSYEWPHCIRKGGFIKVKQP